MKGDHNCIYLQGRFNFTYQVSNSYDSGNGELVPVVTEMGICYTYNSEVAAHFTPQYVNLLFDKNFQFTLRFLVTKNTAYWYRHMLLMRYRKGDMKN